LGVSGFERAGVVGSLDTGERGVNAKQGIFIIHLHNLTQIWIKAMVYSGGANLTRSGGLFKGAQTNHTIIAAMQYAHYAHIWAKFSGDMDVPDR
jgi:hypothetical protein